ncbi:DUF6702 family protein [Persicobacter psychrovividus]
MKRIFVIIGLIFCLFMIQQRALAHPFHISVLDIYFKPAQKVLQVEGKVFMDDLADAIKADTGFEIDYDQPLPKQLIEAYLEKHVIFSVNGKAKPFNFVGMETEDGAIWIYWSVEKVKPKAKVKVSNTLFIRLFSDQQNLVNLTDPQGVRSERLTQGNQVAVFELRNQ